MIVTTARFEEGATLFWQIVAAFRKKRQFHIYRLHEEIVIKSSIVCLRNETNDKQTTDICHLATVFVVIAELASIAIHCTEIIVSSCAHYFTNRSTITMMTTFTFKILFIFSTQK